MGAIHSIRTRRTERRTRRGFIEKSHIFPPPHQQSFHVSWDQIVQCEDTHSVNNKIDENDSIHKEFVLFQKQGEIQPEGLVKLIDTLGINDVSSMRALWVAWKLGAKEYKISEGSFRKCFETLKITTLNELKSLIPENPLKDNLTAKKLFIYSFDCNVEYHQKRIDKEDSIQLLHQFFGEEHSMVNKFIEYLSLDSTKSLNKDEWQNLYDFIITINSDLSNYDDSENSSWPLVFDGFVKYLQH